MEQTSLQELIHRCMEQESLAAGLSNKYDTIQNNITLINDDILDELRVTVLSENFNFYINIDEIDQQTKNIRKYALGVTNPQENEANVIRYDNEPHHNDKPSVKTQNPPHHKHLANEQRVVGSSGNIEEILNGIAREIETLSL